MALIPRVLLLTKLISGDVPEVSTMQAVEKKLFVGTAGGRVSIIDSATREFLSSYSWHEGRVDALLLLPEEAKPCICLEIPFESPKDSGDTQSRKFITSAPDNIHSIPNPEPDSALIISIGKGRTKCSTHIIDRPQVLSPHDIVESTMHSYLLIWKS